MFTTMNGAVKGRFLNFINKDMSFSEDFQEEDANNRISAYPNFTRNTAYSMGFDQLIRSSQVQIPSFRLLEDSPLFDGQSNTIESSQDNPDQCCGYTIQPGKF
jgi:hypothetical protein